jgi:hypothetical protein
VVTVAVLPVPDVAVLPLEILSFVLFDPVVAGLIDVVLPEELFPVVAGAIVPLVLFEAVAGAATAESEPLVAFEAEVAGAPVTAGAVELEEVVFPWPVGGTMLPISVLLSANALVVITPEIAVKKPAVTKTAPII